MKEWLARAAADAAANHGCAWCNDAAARVNGARDIARRAEETRETLGLAPTCPKWIGKEVETMTKMTKTGTKTPKAARPRAPRAAENLDGAAELLTTGEELAETLAAERGEELAVATPKAARPRAPRAARAAIVAAAGPLVVPAAVKLAALREIVGVAPPAPVFEPYVVPPIATLLASPRIDRAADRADRERLAAVDRGEPPPDSAPITPAAPTTPTGEPPPPPDSAPKTTRKRRGGPVGAVGSAVGAPTGTSDPDAAALLLACKVRAGELLGASDELRAAASRASRAVPLKADAADNLGGRELLAASDELLRADASLGRGEIHVGDVDLLAASEGMLAGARELLAAAEPPAPAAPSTPPAAPAAPAAPSEIPAAEVCGGSRQIVSTPGPHRCGMCHAVRLGWRAVDGGLQAIELHRYVRKPTRGGDRKPHVPRPHPSFVILQTSLPLGPAVSS
jgi:hypothetical protein